ncbi:MAG: hypothetical protein GY716_09895 [bacterium]|nr:hypothetical protein [bacterium]
MVRPLRLGTAIAFTAVVLAIATPALAVCGSYGPLTSIPQSGGRSYIWNEDVFTPQYFDHYVYGYTPPVTENLYGVWWRLGTGNPVEGLGDDSGTFDVIGSGAVYFYGPSPGYYTYYGGLLFTGWGANPNIDGCVQQADSCTCLLLVDQTGDHMQMALLAARSDATLTTEFAQPGTDGGGNAGPIVLRRIPKPQIVGVARVFPGEIEIALVQHPLPGIYDTGDCNCEEGAMFSIYSQEVQRGSPPPSTRDLSAWTYETNPVPLGQVTHLLTHACFSDADVYLAAEILFTTTEDGAFSTQRVTTNSTRIECGPNHVDMPDTIRPKRENRPLTPRGPKRR